jgi:hypothetical protein
MESVNNNRTTMNRIKFFSLTAKGAFALIALKLLPFRFTGMKSTEKKKINVRINSFAVRRNNKGSKHG